MKSGVSSLLMLFSVSFIFLCLAPDANAADTILPAGTLVRCVADEPNFNSHTANVGDPLLCRPRPLFLFGRSVLPRGSYIAGHLESYEDPTTLSVREIWSSDLTALACPTIWNCLLPAKSQR